MIQNHQEQNSWYLEIQEDDLSNWHHFFCECDAQFKHKACEEDYDFDNVKCLSCENDYFKNAEHFLNISSTKIYKDIGWNKEGVMDDKEWRISLRCNIPSYSKEKKEIVFQNYEFARASLKKDGELLKLHVLKEKFIASYYLFIDDKAEPFRKILINSAKGALAKYIFENSHDAMAHLQSKDFKKLQPTQQIRCIQFFIKNPHLDEFELFLWDNSFIENLHTINKEEMNQLSLLGFISGFTKSKNLKKALYKTYEASLYLEKRYNPYSDYIFTRTITNKDLLHRLYQIHPFVKNKIFTEETFASGGVLIEFLKLHYSEIQIVSLFTQEMQDKKLHTNAMIYWRDTLMMLGREHVFEHLRDNFVKVKLTSKRLHDEIVRVFHTINYKRNGKELFEYSPNQLQHEYIYEELDFRLPKTISELNLWSKILHNCMFGYVNRIHNNISTIYGVFRDNDLLYAVEISNAKIIQARAILNKEVEQEDMDIIKSWNKKMMQKNEIM